jgi:hypothetical protein
MGIDNHFAFLFLNKKDNEYLSFFVNKKYLRNNEDLELDIICSLLLKNADFFYMCSFWT